MIFFSNNFDRQGQRRQQFGRDFDVHSDLEPRFELASEAVGELSDQLTDGGFGTNK